MTNVCERGRTGFALLKRIAAIVWLLSPAAPAFAAAPITVHIDRARLIKLPERAATVVIGNPLIADLSIQPGGLAVITGKGYGATNLIVLDRDGAVLTEKMLEVQGPTDPTVVVYRGTSRETYSCTPDCSRRITLGDDSQYFNATLDQATTRSNQAMAAGAQSAGAGGTVASVNNPPAPAPAPAAGSTSQTHANQH
jgi:Flp pilus assembly secretin CpaC